MTSSPNTYVCMTSYTQNVCGDCLEMNKQKIELKNRKTNDDETENIYYYYLGCSSKTLGNSGKQYT